jgi:hypothetical protein
MLASFKPIAWNLYAPTGITGEYRPLTHIPTHTYTPTQQQQQQPPQQGQQQPPQQQQQVAPPPPCAVSQVLPQLCPEQLPLSSCRATCRHTVWGDSAGGAGSRGLEAWRSRGAGLGLGADRLAAAGQGLGPWYLPHEDRLVGVWEWDTAETPLVLTPGG